LAVAIKVAAETLFTNVQEATSKHPDWQKVHLAITQAEKDFHAACDAKGLTPEEAEKLKETEEQHRLKQNALKEKQEERDKLFKQQPDIKELLQDLTNN
jgi:hypothetical protein